MIDSIQLTSADSEIIIDAWTQLRLGCYKQIFINFGSTLPNYWSCTDWSSSRDQSYRESCIIDVSFQWYTYETPMFSHTFFRDMRLSLRIYIYIYISDIVYEVHTHMLFHRGTKSWDVNTHSNPKIRMTWNKWESQMNKNGKYIHFKAFAEFGTVRDLIHDVPLTDTVSIWDFIRYYQGYLYFYVII